MSKSFKQTQPWQPGDIACLLRRDVDIYVEVLSFDGFWVTVRHKKDGATRQHVPGELRLPPEPQDPGKASS